LDAAQDIAQHRPQFALLHDSLPQPVAVFDGELRLVYANPSWTALHAATQRTGAPGPGLDGDLHAAALRCLQAGAPVELSGWRSDVVAAICHWDLTFAPFGEAGASAGLICIAHDATARVQAEQAASAKARLAAFRADVSQALASSDDVDAVLQACAEAMVRHAPAAFGRIWVINDAEDVYRLRASAGLYTNLNGTYARIPVSWLRDASFPAHEPGISIDLLRTHRVRDPQWAADNGLVAWASHPLVVRGQVIGFMVMFARQNFDEDTLNELAAVADALAQFLERKHAEEILRERELLFRSVFESAADGLIISDLDSGQVLAANPTICAMHGLTHAEFMQLRRNDLVHPDAHDELAAYVATIRSGTTTRVRLWSVRRDGTRFPVVVQGSQISYQGRPAVLSIIRDVTGEQEAQQQLERRVEERTRELTLLLDISRSVASTLDPQPLLQLILEQLETVIDYTGTAVLIREGDDLIIAGQRGPLSAEDAARIRYPVAGLAPVWERLQAGETIVIPDVRGDSAEASVFRTLVGADLDEQLSFIGSCLWAPLVVKDELIGLLSITRQTPRAFDTRQAAMAAAIARQAAVAIENARLHEHSRMVAALEERQRLARELHDSVSQALFGIGLGAETARTMLAEQPARALQSIEYVLQLAQAGMAEMRALIFELRPESLEQEGLVAALEKQASATRARYMLDVVLALDAEPQIPLTAKEALYRVAQEAMHNTVKHARATRIDLRLTNDSDGHTLEVGDNGLGFDCTAAFPGHLGLVSMQERIARVGGSVTIDSAPGEGTRVRVRLPRPQP
jgi:PAS domain S-box-containing protein